PLVSFGFVTSETQQYFVNVDALYQISDDLNGEVVATYSGRDSDVRRFFVSTLSSGALSVSDQPFDTNYEAGDVTASLNGVLLHRSSGDVKFALGGDYLDEHYLEARTLLSGQPSGRILGRTTSSMFGELLAPVVGPSQNMPFFHRLELSL